MNQIRSLFLLSFILLSFFSLQAKTQQQPTLSLSLGSDTLACDSLILDASSPNATSYLWNTNENTASITADTSGLYWVEISDGTTTLRDTIQVTIQASAVVSGINDTTICGAGPVTLSTDGSMFRYNWYDSPSANNLLTQGTSYTPNISSNTTLYIEAIQGYSGNVGLVGTQNFNPNSYVNFSVATFFDVAYPLTLDSVAVYVDAVGTSFLVRLKDNNNNILTTRNVTVNQAGVKAFIYLDFDIGVGTGYGLEFVNISGGNIARKGNAAYPQSIPGVITLTGNGVNTNLNYSFYDWHVSYRGCASDLLPVQIDIAPDVVIDLGNDSLICGNGPVVLDAGNASSSFLWSTQAVSQTISVDTTGEYRVTVTNAFGCTGQDSIELSFVEIPSDPTINDTSRCGPGTISLFPQYDGMTLFWYDSLSSSTQLFAGEGFTPSIAANTSDTYYVESANVLIGQVGRPQANVSFATFNNHTSFDVFEPIILDSIAVYTDGFNSFKVNLKDNNGALIQSKTFSLNTNGLKEFISLNFELPPAQGYQLEMEHISGAGLGRNGNINYPTQGTLPGYIELTSNSFGNTTNYFFYDWHYSYVACISNRVPITVTADTLPVVDLGEDTAVCASSFLLDAGNAGAIYYWQINGASTQTLLVDSSDVYVVGVENGFGCNATDSIDVILVDVPQAPIPNDTAVCGPQSVNLYASHSNQQLFWYDSLNATSPFFVGDTHTQIFDTTTTYYVEGVNGFNGTVGTESPNNLNPSSFFDFTSSTYFDLTENIVLDSVAVYVDAPTTFKINLRDQNTNTLYQTREFSVNATLAKVFVAVNFYIEAGNDYALEFEHISGGGLVRGGNAPYPINSQGIITLTGNQIGNTTTYYFYDWHYSVPTCFSNRQAITLTVNDIPVVDLGPDTLLCGVTNYTLDLGNPGSSYFWSVPGSGQTITVNNSGWYSGIVLTPQQCFAEDSVLVTFEVTPSNPILQDTVICGEATVDLLAVSDGEQILWYDSLNSTTPFFAGTTYNQTFTTTTTLYAEAVNSVKGQIVREDFGSPNSVAFFSGSVETFFDVFETIVLDSVAVFTRNNVSFDVQLKDAANNIIYEKAFSINTPAGDTLKSFLPLSWVLPAGNGYHIGFDNMTGAGLARGGGANYDDTNPLGTVSKIDGIIDQTSNDQGNNTTYSFYDWHLSYGGCISERRPVTVTINPIPQVDFGPDTVLCGTTGLILNAGNVGSSYTWTTGDLSQTIIVDSSDVYGVEVTNQFGCVEGDTIRVAILDTPGDPIVADTTVCGPAAYTLNGTHANGNLYWYDDPVGNQALYIGDNFQPFIQDTTTYYVESVNPARASIGLEENVSPSGNFVNFNINTIFSVYEPIVLDSVAVYANSSNTTFRIELLDDQGNLLQSKFASINIPLIKTYIPLDFFIPPGNGYELRFNNLNGGELARGGQLNYPVLYEDILSIDGNALGNSTVYTFYDWQFSFRGCVSNRLPLTVNVKPAPVVDLGVDTLLCGASSFSLNAGNPGDSYNWNTGASTQSISTSNTGIYFVTVSNSFNCSDRDSIELIFKPIPNAPTAASLTICGPETIKLGGGYNAEHLYWFDQAVGGNPIFIGDSLTTNITDTSTFYLQAVNAYPQQVGFEGINNPPPNAYVTFDVGTEFNVQTPLMLDSVAVITNATNVSFRVILYDGSGAQLYNRFVNTPAIAGEKTFVSLDFFIPPGNNYVLTTENISAGGLARGGSGVYPSEIPSVIRLVSNSIGNSSQYAFFDWHVSYFGCESPRTALNVNVTLPLNLPTSLYECDAFTLSSGVANATYQWNTGATSQDIVITQAGTYTVTVTDGAGCVQTDSVEVGLPILELGNDGILCGNELNAGLPGSTYDWNTGDSTQIININDPGNYVVEVNEPGGCILVDSIQVTGFQAIPQVDLGVDISVCDSAVLSAGSFGANYFYDWSTGESSDSIMVSSTGFYDLQVTSPNGCQGTDTIFVAINTAPVADFSYTAIGPTINIINLSDFGTTKWVWGDGTSSNQLNPGSHTYPAAGTYTLQLIVSNDCGSDTLEQEIEVFGVGIDDELMGRSLSIYPNPTEADLFIELRGDVMQNSWQVELVDMNGRSVLQQKVEAGNMETKLILDDLPPAIYMLRIQAANQSIWKRVVVR